MKKILELSFVFLFLSSFVLAANQSDIKQEAIALYKTGNYDAAYEKLLSIPSGEKDETTFLLMANVLEMQGKDNKAIHFTILF